MAVIALTSASGSPGVTTTALGLALLWPRPVLLVEADPTGGSGLLAGYFRGTREYDGGLIELALTASRRPRRARRGVRTASRARTARSSPAPGRTPRRAALRDLWQPLAEALADLESTGQDVIVDAGRLGLVGSPEPLLAAADLTLLVTRTTLPALSAAALVGRRRSSAAPSTGSRPASSSSARASPTARARSPRSLGLPVVATLADDPSRRRSSPAEPRRRRGSRPGHSSAASRPRSPRSTRPSSRRRSELLEGARP